MLELSAQREFPENFEAKGKKRENDASKRKIRLEKKKVRNVLKFRFSQFIKPDEKAPSTKKKFHRKERRKLTQKNIKSHKA